MNVCIDPRASLESGVGEHAGKAITAFPGVYVEVAKVSMEGLCCGTNGGEMYFPPDPEVSKEATVLRERSRDWSLGASAAAGTGKQVARRNEPVVWKKIPKRGWRWAASREPHLARRRHSTRGLAFSLRLILWGSLRANRFIL